MLRFFQFSITKTPFGVTFQQMKRSSRPPPHKKKVEREGGTLILKQREHLIDNPLEYAPLYSSFQKFLFLNVPGFGALR